MSSASMDRATLGIPPSDSAPMLRRARLMIACAVAMAARSYSTRLGRPSGPPAGRDCSRRRSRRVFLLLFVFAARLAATAANPKDGVIRRNRISRRIRAGIRHLFPSVRLAQLDFVDGVDRAFTVLRVPHPIHAPILLAVAT